MKCYCCCCCCCYSRCCFMDVIDPRNLPLKFGQNQVSNSWDIDDVEFVLVGGGGGRWCKFIFMSNPTFVWLGWVELWLSLGFDNTPLSYLYPTVDQKLYSFSLHGDSDIFNCLTSWTLFMRPLIMCRILRKGRDGILCERRREHARGRNLADCGRICGSPHKSFGSIEEMWKIIPND